MQKQDLKTIERLTNENSTYPKIPFGLLIEECMKDYLEYRKSEEQGLLFQFPCKVGDTVYAIFSKNNLQFFEYQFLTIITWQLSFSML